MKRVVAIILARGGSKGIPGKNLADFCGRPLVAWTVEQARRAETLQDVWVSSDSAEILAVAARHGGGTIERPVALADDEASSESAWLHALDVLEAAGSPVDLVVGLQATSPIREPEDVDAAVRQFQAQRLDSLLSVVEVEAPFLWTSHGDGTARPLNYDYRARPRRQALGPQYVENGSFYLFTARLLRETGSRLGGRIGLYMMARHTMFQIDTPDDLRLCQIIMRGYGLAP